MKEIRHSRAGGTPVSPAQLAGYGAGGAAEINLTASSETSIDASRCPLCGQPNDCQLCTAAAYKGPCWCASAHITDELLARVPLAARNRACICRACVTDVPLCE